MASHRSQDIIQNLNRASSKALFDLVPSYLALAAFQILKSTSLPLLQGLCIRCSLLEHSSSWSWPPFTAERLSNILPPPAPCTAPWYCPSQQYSVLFLQSIHQNLHLLICVFLECLSPPDNKSSLRVQRSFLLIHPLSSFTQHLAQSLTLSEPSINVW